MESTVAKVLMIQGTMSGAGKSMVVTGLCRLFKNRGYRVAPFKAQNMALNSFITKEGLEMGRAQVVQAEAAGIEPNCLMNPLLLKPVSDVGSQVILNGKVLGNYKAKEFYKIKKDMVKPIMDAYAKLAKDYDLIIVEGAGSPAEINLRKDDLVNMGLALRINSPVFIVGDIDRGGVFAQLYGTMELISEEERALVKGVIINKFRGDVELLKPGLNQLEELIHKPTIGVLPYQMLDIDDEDSQSERLDSSSSKNSLLDIAVIRVKHMSNYSDFTYLASQPEVSLRYVSSPIELGNPDLIILPGSKNTIYDLNALKSDKFEIVLTKAHERGIPIVGICGGYQMLGRVISDPLGVEGVVGAESLGLNLLNTQTTLEGSKETRQISGTINNCGGDLKSLSGCSVEGYEIHMGKTKSLDGNDNVFIKTQSGVDGFENNGVYGTYLHGFFDTNDVVRAIVKDLCEKKGLTPYDDNDTSSNYFEYKEEQYNKLAKSMEEYFDVDEIIRIIEEGI
jgi:adenosylcobyric acid synthase